MNVSSESATSTWLIVYDKITDRCSVSRQTNGHAMILWPSPMPLLKEKNEKHKLFCEVLYFMSTIHIAHELFNVRQEVCIQCVVASYVVYVFLFFFFFNMSGVIPYQWRVELRFSKQYSLKATWTVSFRFFTKSEFHKISKYALLFLFFFAESYISLELPFFLFFFLSRRCPY